MFLIAHGQLLEYRDVPAPTLQPDDMLIQAETCAICCADLYIIDRELPSPKL